MKNQVLSFGEVLWDAFGDGKKAGGAPMNVARHLVQQGVKVAFASSVGLDNSGDMLIEFLKSNGLYSDLIQQEDEYPTCEVTVQLDENNQATYIIPEPVSWDYIETTDALNAAAKNSAAIVYGSLACRSTQTRETLLNLLDETDALKIFDVNLRPPHYTLSTIETLVARADVVKMNEDEANLLIGGSSSSLRDQITEFRSKYHNRTICVTRGEHGAIVWHDYEFYESPGCPVKVGDSVGAGDAFLATFVAGLLANHPMQTVVDKACTVGAYVASQRGANPIYPTELLNSLVYI
ncbi:carbohydrate kinase family protein [Mucilaginibacter ginsenosidivorax]|uniref:Carbohydrate kinase n=1 Tax=Mucilaginibacter ginsenosidivorax TaxID=862126 RepID=A0A5B8W1C1_9SPHI|nr:carbohydrate kinase [Mucilaginibacter ginsenosidivorax]QEC76058.1 carbohydrate kinase [Mucilaginibacter ginsenosidivorax]